MRGCGSLMLYNIRHRYYHIRYFVPMHTGSSILRWFVVSGQGAVLMVLRDRRCKPQAHQVANHTSRDRNLTRGPRCLMLDAGRRSLDVIVCKSVPLVTNVGICNGYNHGSTTQMEIRIGSAIVMIMVTVSINRGESLQAKTIMFKTTLSFFDWW